MKTVLLVDDEELALNRMVTMLDWGALGCRIIGTARNSSEAMAMIEADEPDILITDIVMPGMDGIEMISRLSGRYHGKIIVVSGYQEFRYARQAIHMGVVDYLLKPFTAAELAETVKRCFGGGAQAVDYEKEYGTMVGRIMRAVEEHLSDPQLTLTWLCENELFMNETHSGRQFQKKVGMKFSAWVTKRRITEACRILRREQDLSVAEVAERVGFSSDNYFSEVFKKQMEMTPSQYRKQEPAVNGVPGTDGPQ